MSGCGNVVANSTNRLGDRSRIRGVENRIGGRGGNVVAGEVDGHGAGDEDVDWARGLVFWL